MMFRNLAAGEPQAELFCSTLMHALLVAVLTVTDSVNIPKGKAGGRAAYPRTAH